MSAYAYLLIAFATILWFAPFVAGRARRRTAPKRDTRARWGIALQCLAYSLLWQSSFWERSLEWWRASASVAFFTVACVVSWTAARALGRQFQFDAAVDTTHELVQAGPYRLVRHPIYASMLCVLLATGILISPLYLLVAATAVFLTGTEIRMRVEDKLLASHFGTQFRNYRQSVPRLVPFLKWRT